MQHMCGGASYSIVIYKKILQKMWHSLKTKGHQFDNFVINGGTIMTTYGVASDDKVVKLMSFIFRGCKGYNLDQTLNFHVQFDMKSCA